MTTGITRRVATGVAAAAATSLVLAACDGDDTAQSDGEEQPADEANDTNGSDDSPGPGQRVSFTEPVDTEIACDECEMSVVGDDGAGHAAIAENLPMPDLEIGGDAPTTLHVVDADGTTVWSDDGLTWEDESDPDVVDTQAWATNSALVARPDADTLVGLDWSDGSSMWTTPDVGFGLDIEPLDERDDILQFSESDRSTEGYFEGYTRLGVVDTTDGSVLWDSQDVEDYDLSPDGQFLVTVEFADDGATLTHVDLDDGSTTEVVADSWRGPGSFFEVTDDGTITASVGIEDAENKAVDVDWEGEPTVADVQAEQDAPGVPGHPNADEVRTHEESGLALAATSDDDLEPQTAVIVDAEGNELWDAPADEVLQWNEMDVPEGSPPQVEITGAEFEELPDGEPVLLVDRSPETRFGTTYHGSVETDGATFSAYDARSGEQLWSWGDQARAASFAVPDRQGVFYGVQGGVLDEDPVHGENEPATADLALLDLRTGEPDWEVTGPETLTPLVHALDDVVVTQIGSGQPMMVSARTEHAR